MLSGRKENTSLDILLHFIIFDVVSLVTKNYNCPSLSHKNLKDFIISLCRKDFRSGFRFYIFSFAYNNDEIVDLKIF